ncbi:carbohydrate binding domain-containing protein [Algibacter sp. Ld11]|uniref:carbohydrate binding domain-containing protein n=1 Tax=Algibacter sp. Ld11 TaxID=649150 RepID=UPI00386D3BE4
MKTTKILSFLCLSLAFWSCSDDDAVIELTQPQFTVTAPEGESGFFTFENTTPNKEEFYSFWEFEVGGSKVIDQNGPFVYEYKSSGSKTVKLTMVSALTNLHTSQNITVTLPPPSDIRHLINPENLLANGYFGDGEGNDFTNWGKNNGADRMTEERSEPLVGSRAVKINNDVDGNEWETQLVSDAFSTVDGEKYTASVWIKGSPVSIRFSTNPGVGGDQYAGNYTATSDWTQYSWTFVANSATTLLALDMGKTKGTFIIDAVEVVTGEVALPLPSNDSELLNGDLEAGEENDFTNWSQNNGADRMTQETVDVLSGSRALRVNNGVDGNEWEAQMVSDGFATENGADYTVSLWIKGDAVSVRYSTNPGANSTEQYAGGYIASAEWTKYDWTFTANSDTSSIALDMGKTKGTFLIDAIKVVKN